MTKKRSHAHRELKSDEKVLWNRVTRTVIPMHGQKASRTEGEEDFAAMMSPDPAPKKSAPIVDENLRRAHKMAKPGVHASQDKAKIVPSPAPIAAHIDRPVYRKIAKGRLPIDSQIDLHNMTQEQAFQRLQMFLSQAHDMGHRHVLVITGKGGSPTSEGVLRRMLPVWLNTPSFAHIVNGYQVASRGHGGDGAFYVRLRRQR